MLLVLRSFYYNYYKNLIQGVLNLLLKMAGASAGIVVSKDVALDVTLDEEVIDVLTYWFGTAYWNKQVTVAPNSTYTIYDCANSELYVQTHR